MADLSKRTRLRAVYLTDTERDLLIGGMLHLHDALQPANVESLASKPTKFARSFTSRRIADVVAILRGPDKSASPSENVNPA